MARMTNERVGAIVVSEMFGDLEFPEELDDLGGDVGGGDIDDLGDLEDLDSSDLEGLDSGFDADIDINPDVDASLIGDVSLGSAWMLPAGAGIGLLGGALLGGGLATAGMRSERRRKTKDARKDQRIADRRARRDGLDGLTPESLAKVERLSAETVPVRFGALEQAISKFGWSDREIDRVLDEDDEEDW